MFYPAVRLKSGWDESQHPRVPQGSGDPSGQFTSGGGGEGATAQDPAELTGLHYDKEKKRWLRADGEPVSDETAARIKAAGVKPAYTDVELNADPNAALQAKGKDAKGRTQYMYSKAHSERAAAEKFSRLHDFHGALPNIRAGLAATLANKSLPAAERDAAAVLTIIESTGIRVGNTKETGGAVKAYGASTLQGEHITLGPKGRIDLKFIGKSGKENVATLTNPVLHAYLGAKGLAAGKPVFTTSSTRVGATLDRLSGTAGFSPKDFRTWTGTSVALRAIENLPTPSTAREYAHQRLEVAKVVAKHLNNTPTVALQAYIDPAVFKRWESHAPSHAGGKAWNPEDHPRVPADGPGGAPGGQFTSGGSDGAATLPRGFVGEMTAEEKELYNKRNGIEKEAYEEWAKAKQKVEAVLAERLKGKGFSETEIEAYVHVMSSSAANEFPEENHPFFARYRELSAEASNVSKQIQRLVDARVGPPEFEAMRQLGEFARPQTNTPEFKRWFGESEVVDGAGRPLIAFHGTKSGEIKKFEHSDIERKNPLNAGPLGHWFAAPNADSDYDLGNAEVTAEVFAGERHGATVYPVFLSIRKPVEYFDYEELITDVDRAGSAKKLRQKLAKAGHDGVVIRGSTTDGNQSRDDWVAFSSTQIKSAIGNSGKFSRSDPDITKARK